MTSLGQVVQSVRNYRNFVRSEVKRVRNEPKAAEKILNRWREMRSEVGTTEPPTGIKLPTLALPEIDEPGEITRFLLEEGLPGEFPYFSAAYPKQYLASGRSNGSSANSNENQGEEPTRLFAGLRLPEDTNARLHYLSRNQQNKRLITAFDRPTTYAAVAGAPVAFG